MVLQRIRELQGRILDLLGENAANADGRGWAAREKRSEPHSTVFFSMSEAHTTANLIAMSIDPCCILHIAYVDVVGGSQVQAGDSICVVQPSTRECSVWIFGCMKELYGWAV